ncbi:phosphatidylinositol N-acetylglucosaminyltransferase gpi19 [Vanrija albida]|uniref:Phosphatidylinositol N-acetylglucosaminyltransferase gpi19 n=1 Tax=Vanrija albida TaxID=181172 RepID=A0ABR3QE42_9TREE
MSKRSRRAAGASSADPDSPAAVAAALLAPLGLTPGPLTTLQTLWAGYGSISSFTAVDGSGGKHPLILKLVAPPDGSSSDEGHRRKMLSYAVEQHFYAAVVPALNLPPEVGVARVLATSADGAVATVLEDLRQRYPVAGEHRGELSERQVDAALLWLARFHSASRGYGRGKLAAFVRPPLVETEEKKEVWLNGGYTYLATRMSEFASLQRGRGEWRVLAEVDGAGNSPASLAALFLEPRGRAFESLIHGDVKSENLFASAAGDRVAFFDFQYVGLGLGVCDLAKLFTCSVPLGLLVEDKRREKRRGMGKGEEALLRKYLEYNGSAYDWDEFTRHWETALVDWCRFQASWGWWGNTDWLQSRVREILADGGWRRWVEGQASAGISAAAQ